jgi:hypothetical protein
MPGMSFTSASAAGQLERGGIVVHGALRGMPAATGKQLGAPFPPVVDRGHSAGFGVVNLAALLSSVPEQPIGGGVTSASLARSLVGPLTLNVPAGALAFDIRVPLTDPVPAQTLIDHCADLLPVTVAALSQNGSCHVPVPMLGTALDAWVEGNTLRLGMKEPPKAADVPLTRAGAELANGTWSFAFWGRGTLLAAPQIDVPPEAANDPGVQAALRAILMVNEVGLGVRVDGDRLTFVAVVRTAFANPDDVVTRLATLTPTDVLSGKGPELAASFGSGATPIAEDIKAGYAGLMLPISLISMASASAVPAVLHYIPHDQRPEKALAR